MLRKFHHMHWQRAGVDVVQVSNYDSTRHQQKLWLISEQMQHERPTGLQNVAKNRHIRCLRAITHGVTQKN